MSSRKNGVLGSAVTLTQKRGLETGEPALSSRKTKDSSSGRKVPRTSVTGPGQKPSGRSKAGAQSEAGPRPEGSLLLRQSRLREPPGGARLVCRLLAASGRKTHKPG